MPEWQERISRDTHPAIRVEHEARYRLAAPIVRGAPLWCDLGCGSGVASAAALGDAIGERVLLVDVAQDAVAQAAVEVGAPETRTLTADLATADGVTAVRDALLAGPPGATITCFEVVEHLASFVEVVELLVALAAEAEATTILSVPNDAYFSIENPYHQTMWGEGAFEELRRLLPADHVAAQQIPLVGSIVAVGDAPFGGTAATTAPRADAIPSHMIAAFGPRAAELRPLALAGAADLDGQRSWERQREATLAFHEDELAELRAYVHDLERRLGERPPATDAA